MSNGRLKSSALAPITRAVNGEQAYLRKDAARAFNAMNAEAQKLGVTLRVSSARSAYRPYSEQVYFWNLYLSGRGNLAARPGTSNHGLGLAVDLATPAMRAMVDRIGAKYGWAKAWSDAPSEWWHLRWREGDYQAVRKAADKLAGFSPSERRYIREYDRLLAKGKRRTRKERERSAQLWQWMKRRRKVIWRLAQPKARGGDGKGWGHARRHVRYESLKARTS
jgi:hypothetical protein